MKILNKVSAYNAKLDGLGYAIFSLLILFGFLIFVGVASTIYALFIGSYFLALISFVMALILLFPFFITLKISSMIAASASIRNGATMVINTLNK